MLSVDGSFTALFFFFLPSLNDTKKAILWVLCSSIQSTVGLVTKNGVMHLRFIYIKKNMQLLISKLKYLSPSFNTVSKWIKLACIMDTDFFLSSTPPPHHFVPSSVWKTHRCQGKICTACLSAKSSSPTDVTLMYDYTDNTSNKVQYLRRWDDHFKLWYSNQIS